MDRLTSLTPRLRIDFGTGIRLGPGKIDLMEAIVATGSISGAGRKLGMSYRRAWLLVEELNSLFTSPAVMTNIGGAQGGGAQVTALGLRVISAFRRIEAATRAAVDEEMAALGDDIPPLPGAQAP